MKQGRVCISVVIDGSSSMSAIAPDVKRTFEAFIDEQMKLPGNTTIDVYQFSEDLRRLVRVDDLASVRDGALNDYSPRGCTALCDAVCDVIDDLGDELRATAEEERPELVAVAVLTDGMENASKRRRPLDVLERVHRQQHIYCWRFVFLGANIDSREVGATLGFEPQDCADFEPTPEGLANVGRLLGAYLDAFRKERLTI